MSASWPGKATASRRTPKGTEEVAGGDCRKVETLFCRHLPPSPSRCELLSWRGTVYTATRRVQENFLSQSPHRSRHTPCAVCPPDGTRRVPDTASVVLPRDWPMVGRRPEVDVRFRTCLLVVNGRGRMVAVGTVRVRRKRGWESIARCSETVPCARAADGDQLLHL